MCPKGTTIYHAGDIGWDVYFIGGGLVKIKLPQDLSILDEEGRANIERTKEKAKAIGVVYRPGNHFGECCLESITGVRRESTIATTAVELYLLSKEKLDNIFTYTPLREKERLQRSLMSRNGNVWHSFENRDTTLKQVTSSPRRSRIVKSSTSFLSWTQPPRMSAIKIGDSDAPLDRRSTKRRLRSFSAEASCQALMWNRDGAVDTSTLTILDEHILDSTAMDPQRLL
jgi:CRP-like cAMP-binding protein